jgi:hypothetical protein
LIVAICLLGTEVSRYFIHVAKNASSGDFEIGST